MHIDVSSIKELVGCVIFVYNVSLAQVLVQRNDGKGHDCSLHFGYKIVLKSLKSFCFDFTKRAAARFWPTINRISQTCLRKCVVVKPKNIPYYISWS